MRIVTMCTLAFAICGDRVEKPSKTVPSKISATRRWLAKSLLLGASVHAASGFVQPPHPAKGFGRPAGLRALEPSKGISDTIKENNIGIAQKVFDAGENNIGIAQKVFDAGDIEDALVVAERIGEVLVYAEVRHRLEPGQDVSWEEQKSQWAIYLQNLNEKDFEELWLDVMVENVKCEAKVGYELLAKIDDETSFLSSKAEWKALEDDVRDFQKWRDYARNRYGTIYSKLIKTVAGGRLSETLVGDGARALKTWKGAMNPLSKLRRSQRWVKAKRILDVLDAAELGRHFNVDGIPWEEYDTDLAPGPTRYPKLMEHLQSMKGKPLKNLWLSVRRSSYHEKNH